MNKVRMHTGGFTATNGYAFHVPGGCIVVDAPAGMAGWLADTGQRAAALFLTHWHFDHVMDAAAIAREHQCPVYAWGPSTSADRLEDMIEAFTGFKPGVEDYPVDHSLKGNDAVTIAGADFLLRHVPGHSPDSLVLIHEPSRLLFSGDTLMEGGLGRCDFPGGDFDLLVRGIRDKILSLPGDYRLYPGHGGASTIGNEARENVYVRS